MYAIYKYTDIRNGMIYIGQTNNIKERSKQHLTSNKNNYFDNHLQANPEAFEFEIITNELETRAQANFAEGWWTDYYDCVYPKGYNMRRGGDVYETNEETKNKLREINKGENNPMYGKHHTEEAKQKNREAHLGMHSGINHPMYGKHHSEETKRKMSLHNAKYNLGKHLSEETKQKLSEAAKDRKHSAETKVKMSEAHKGKTVGSANGNSKPCMCVELGMTFESIRLAANWLRKNGQPKADPSAISRCCRGVKNAAYGYHWKYIEEV